MGRRKCCFLAFRGDQVPRGLSVNLLVRPILYRSIVRDVLYSIQVR